MTGTARAVMFGGSGFLGSRLRERLIAAGVDVTIVGRGPTTDDGNSRTVQWDAKTLGDWVAALDGADLIVHLAGKRVDCRPTTANIDQLISSREDSVRLVGRALSQLANPPRTWVQLSSLAIFGDSGDAVIDEDTPPPSSGPRQQVEVCTRWEAAFREATERLDRSVLIRPGISIGGDGDPASAQLAMLARLGLGGSVGGGGQWVSWIATDDLINILERACLNPSMRGTYHATSPNPVTNHDLMASYRKAVGRSMGLPSPALLTKIGAWALGSDPGLALTGRRCVPKRLLHDGFEFTVIDIDQAVLNAVGY